MDMDFCCLTAATSTLTVPCLLISCTTVGSMKVRLASAADDSRNVSDERVFLDRPGS